MVKETFNENGKTLQEIMEQFLILYYNEKCEKSQLFFRKKSIFSRARAYNSKK